MLWWRHAFFLSLNESGHDRKASPYEVLARVRPFAIATCGTQSSPCTRRKPAFRAAQQLGARRAEGCKLLKTRFPHARLTSRCLIPREPRPGAVGLDECAHSTIAHLKHWPCQLAMSGKYSRYAPASLPGVRPASSKRMSNPRGDVLRKYYGYLFEGLYYLEDIGRARAASSFSMSLR
jgi:hypothetical protein